MRSCYSHVIGYETLFAWALLVFLIPASVLCDEETALARATADIVSEGHRAKAIEEKPPAYPPDAKNRLVEGWVRLKYVVNSDGTTSEIEVLDSSVPELFDKSAIDAVSHFRYEPAVWNGFPASDVILDKDIIFFFTQTQGEVSRDFYSRYRSASKAIEEGELEKAEQFIGKLEKRKKWQIAEICYLDLLKGDFWRANNDPEKSLRFYNRALVVAADHAKPEIHESLLRRAFVLNAGSGKLAAALGNYHELTDLLGDMAPDDPAHNLARKIQNFVDGETPFTSHGKIQARCEGCTQLSSAWNQKLLRNRFTVENVQGEVSEIKITCGDAYISFVYEPDTAWDVSKHQTNCDVIVLGEEGTTFSLVEL